MWIYSAGGIVASIFINIYVFSLNKEILDVIFYNLIFFTTTLLGFSGIGWIMSIFRKNIKNMYYIAYFLYILAYLLLFIFNGYLGIYLFAIIYGLGFGAFRCAVHTQELVHIEDKTRDIYSSIISSGQNIINIFMPLFISVIFFIVGKYFNFSAYIILFLLLPLIYLISFLFIKNIGDYIPSKIKKIDIKNFFNLKKYLFGQLYFFSVGVYQGLVWTVAPVIAITILKTESNVGLFEGIITFISTFAVISLASKRNIDNRIKIMGILSFLIFLNISIFVFNFSFVGYIVFSLVGILLNPLYRVSEHVFDLKLMDTIKVKGSDFFPAMILREISLWFGRVGVLFILFLFVYYGLDNENILKIGLLLDGIFLILAWIAIALHIKHEDR